MELEMIIMFVFFINISTWVQPVRGLHPLALMKVRPGARTTLWRNYGLSSQVWVDPFIPTIL